MSALARENTPPSAGAVKTMNFQGYFTKINKGTCKFSSCRNGSCRPHTLLNVRRARNI